MQKPYNIPVSRPQITTEDVASVKECLEAGWVSGEGPIVKNFENELTEKFAKKYAISCSSGTAALDLSISALGLTADDHVVCPSFTIGSCCFELKRRNVQISFIDCDPKTFNSSPENFLGAIKENTKALIVPHIYGFCVDVPEIKKQISNKDIFILEDCAESQFLSYPGSDVPTGTLADIVTLSFYSNKTVVSGEGGAVLCDCPKISEKLEQFRNLAFDVERRFWHHGLGWNYRLNSMSAALASSQLKRADEHINRKIQIGKKYFQKLSKIDEIYVSPPSIDEHINGYWVVPIVLKNKDRIFRSRIMEYLRMNGIGTRPFFEPLHTQPVFKNAINTVALENSEFIGERGLYLPSFLDITDDEIDHVCEKVSSFLLSES